MIKSLNIEQNSNFHWLFWLKTVWTNDNIRCPLERQIFEINILHQSALSFVLGFRSGHLVPADRSVERGREDVPNLAPARVLMEESGVFVSVLSTEVQGPKDSAQPR